MGDKDLKSAEEWIYGKIETPEKEHLLNLQHKKIYERYQMPTDLNKEKRKKVNKAQLKESK